MCGCLHPTSPELILYSPLLLFTNSALPSAIMFRRVDYSSTVLQVLLHCAVVTYCKLVSSSQLPITACTVQEQTRVFRPAHDHTHTSGKPITMCACVYRLLGLSSKHTPPLHVHLQLQLDSLPTGLSHDSVWRLVRSRLLQLQLPDTYGHSSRGQS